MCLLQIIAIHIVSFVCIIQARIVKAAENKQKREREKQHQTSGQKMSKTILAEASPKTTLAEATPSVQMDNITLQTVQRIELKVQFFIISL